MKIRRTTAHARTPVCTASVRQCSNGKHNDKKEKVEKCDAKRIARRAKQQVCHIKSYIFELSHLAVAVCPP